VDPFVAEIPVGFEPLFRTSPFLDMLGPFFYRRTECGLVIGLSVADKHANARGGTHGGLLLTLADVALGYTAAYSEDPPLMLTTVHISADFAGHARVDDWVEAHVDVQKIGRRLVFANGYLKVGVERIARVSALFARDGAARSPESSGSAT
jgi:acyl-coenzyme A thioesterase 13